MPADNDLSEYVPRNPRLSTLYGIVAEHRAGYFEAVESKTGKSPRGFVKREFDNYLECGIYEHGMMRTQCSDSSCGHEHVVAMSCKGRGFCPSCGGRRMVETATNLTSGVLPHVRYRQFVLTLPIALRFMCGVSRKLLQKVHGIAAEEYKNFYRDGRSSEDGIVGGISFIQRFNSGCDFNLHFHTMMADGVWLENEAGEIKFFQKSLSEIELGEILDDISTRIVRTLRRQGLLNAQGEVLETPVLDDDLGHLEVLAKSMSAKKLFSEGLESLTKIGKGFGFAEEKPLSLKKMTVTKNGFSLHAGTVVNANSRDKLFKLLEYQCRPPISDSRLEVMDSGSVRLKLKRTYSDGTTHIEMSGLEFLAKLHALIPPPLQNQRIYFGVFGGAHSKRSKIVAGAKSKSTRKRCDDKSLVSSTLWCEFIAKTFKMDVGNCPFCKSPMRIISFIFAGKEVFRYLNHTDKIQRGPPQ